MKYSYYCVVMMALAIINQLGCSMKKNKPTIDESPTELRSHILNKDFQTAQQALAEAERLKNTEIVCLSLSHSSLEIRLLGTEALRRMGDKTSVPKLIEALEKNQVAYTGGSETKLLQTKLDLTIISTLESLTGLDLGIKNVTGKLVVQEILNQCREWWDANKGRLNVTP